MNTNCHSKGSFASVQGHYSVLGDAHGSDDKFEVNLFCVEELQKRLLSFTKQTNIIDLLN